MLSLLSWILSGVELIGQYVLFGVESAINAVLAAAASAVSALFALLPSMSDAPSIGTPTWLNWLNWFYPVGDLLAGLAGVVVMWVAFLAVRWALRLVRAL